MWGRGVAAFGRDSLWWWLAVREGASCGQAGEARFVCGPQREGVAAGAEKAGNWNPVPCVDAAWSRRHQRGKAAGVRELPWPRVGLPDREVLQRVITDAE